MPYQIEDIKNKMNCCKCGFTGGCFECNPLFRGLTFELNPEKPKKKLWGLFEGLKIEEKYIEQAKKSLFPDREF